MEKIQIHTTNLNLIHCVNGDAMVVRVLLGSGRLPSPEDVLGPLSQLELEREEEPSPDGWDVMSKEKERDRHVGRQRRERSHVGDLVVLIQGGVVYTSKVKRRSNEHLSIRPVRLELCQVRVHGQSEGGREG